MKKSLTEEELIEMPNSELIKLVSNLNETERGSSGKIITECLIRLMNDYEARKDEENY